MFSIEYYTFNYGAILILNLPMTILCFLTKYFTNLCKVMLMEKAEVASETDNNMILVETNRLKVYAITIGRLSTTLKAILNMMVDNFIIIISTGEISKKA